MKISTRNVKFLRELVEVRETYDLILHQTIECFTHYHGPKAISLIQATMATVRDGIVSTAPRFRKKIVRKALSTCLERRNRKVLASVIQAYEDSVTEAQFQRIVDENGLDS